MYDLLLEAGAANPGLRVVYASSIAVFGDPLPALVDDATLLSPKMIYGGHKAMMEHAVAMVSNRGLIDGVTVRLPGILARPKGYSGMKSAFMSDLFHALKAGETFVCPVSAGGTIWAQWVRCVAANFVHALGLDTALVTYRPDPALELAFAAQPPLATPAADHAGFAHDGNLARLVASALATI